MSDTSQRQLSCWRSAETQHVVTPRVAQRSIEIGDDGVGLVDHQGRTVATAVGPPVRLRRRTPRFAVGREVEPPGPYAFRHRGSDAQPTQLERRILRSGNEIAPYVRQF